MDVPHMSKRQSFSSSKTPIQVVQSQEYRQESEDGQKSMDVLFNMALSKSKNIGL